MEGQSIVNWTPIDDVCLKYKDSDPAGYDFISKTKTAEEIQKRLKFLGYE